MADKEIRERIVVEGADAGVSALNRLSGAAGRVAGSFGGLLSIAGTLGGLGGILAVGETIRETEHLYQAIERVKSITGLAASDAHALFDEFELSGIAMEDTEKIMISLARLTGKMGDGVTESAQQAADLQAIMTKIGVTIKSGPQQKLEEMAKAAQAGKLQINDLIKAFAIPRSQAAQMMTMLQQGPERLRDIQKDTLGSADLIDEAALNSFQTMQQNRRELADAWGGLVGVLYKSVMPAVTHIMEGLTNAFADAEPYIVKIGDFLSTHMNEIVKLAKVYVGLMTGNKLMGVLTGKQMGIADRVKGIAKSAWAKAAEKAAIGAIYGPVTAAQSLRTNNLGVMNGGGGQAGMLGQILKSSVARFGVIGLITATVGGVFAKIASNSQGVRDSFGKLWETVQNIAGKLAPVLEKIAGVVLKIADLLSDQLVFALGKVVDALTWILDKVFPNDPGGALSGANGVHNGANLAWDTMADIADAVGAGDTAKYIRRDIVDAYVTTAVDKNIKKAAPGTDKGKGGNTFQDFRGSTFDITQNFPKDIDAGRVAVSVGDELAALGERRIDSGLRPIYSYR